MKLFGIAAAAISVVHLVITSTVEAAPPVKPGVTWTLNTDFSDEFNEPALNEDKWDTSYNFWTGRDPGLFDSSQVNVSDGLLELSVSRPAGGIADPNKDFLVGSVNTTGGDDRVQGNRHLLYGYFEVRAKGTDATSTSAFWLSRFTGDYSTEIDVIELIEPHPREMPTNLHVFREHGVNLSRQISSPQRVPFSAAGVPAGETFDNSFRTYGLDWNEDTIDFYLDDVLVRSVVNERFHHPMWIHLTNGIQDFVGEPTDQQLANAQPFLVDYLRVYDTERRNWLGHPSFEYYGGGGISDAASWNDQSRAWVSRSPGAARTGEHGLVIDNSLPNDFGGIKNLQPGPQPNRWDVEAGMELEQAIWVQLDEAFAEASNATIDLVLRWNGHSASSSSESFSVSELTLGEWAELSRELTVPATDHLGQPVEFATAFWMLNNGSSAAPQQGVLHYDDAFLGRAVVGLAGDFNGDGTVDAADYTVYRDNLGNPAGLPNDNNLGAVGAAHYELWVANFGQGSSAGAASQAALPAPEPGAISLLIGLGLGLLGAPSRRDRK